MGVCSRCHEKYMTVIAERDEALAKYQFMVNRAADEKLDGYRELGSRLAAMEADRDEWRQQHENALACWSADLRAVKSKHEALAVPNTCVTPHDGGRVLRPHSIPGWWQVWSGGVCVCLLRPEDAISIRSPRSDEREEGAAARAPRRDG